MSGINVFINATDLSRGAFASFSRHTDAATAKVNAFQSRVSQTTKKVRDYNLAAHKTATENRRLGVSFSQLMKLMFQFGIALSIIQLPFRIRDSFVDLVKTTADWEKQLVRLNSILRLDDDQLAKFSNKFIVMGISVGNTETILDGAFDAAQQLVGLSFDPLRKEFEGLGIRAQAVFDITREAQRASIATGTDLNTLTNAIGQTLSLFNLRPSQSRELTNLLFAVQEVSDLRITDLAKNMGQVFGFIDPLSKGDSDRKMELLRETLALVGTMSQSLDPQRAFTGIRNIFTELIKGSKESRTAREQLKGLGLNLDLADIAANGVIGTFRELFKILPQGELIDRWAQAQGNFASAEDESNKRIQESLTLLGKIFPNVRALLGVTGALVQEGEVLEETFERVTTQLGLSERAFDEATRSLPFAISRIQAAIRGLKIAFGTGSISQQVARGLSFIADEIQRIITIPEFQSARTADKIFMFITEFNSRFEQWMNSGGKAKISSIAEAGGRIFAETFAFFISTGSTTKYGEAGVDAAFAFLEGFVKQFTKDFETRIPNLLRSIIVRGLAGVFTVRALGGRNFMTQGAGFLGGSFVSRLGGSNNILNEMISLAVGAYALRGFSRMLGGSAVGQTVKAGALSAVGRQNVGFMTAAGVPIVGNRAGQPINAMNRRFVSPNASIGAVAGRRVAGLGMGRLGTGAATAAGLVRFIGPLGFALGTLGLGGLLAYQHFRGRDDNQNNSINFPKSTGSTNTIQVGEINITINSESDRRFVEDVMKGIKDGFSQISPNVQLPRPDIQERD